MGGLEIRIVILSPSLLGKLPLKWKMIDSLVVAVCGTSSPSSPAYTSPTIQTLFQNSEIVQSSELWNCTKPTSVYLHSETASCGKHLSTKDQYFCRFLLVCLAYKWAEWIHVTQALSFKFENRKKKKFISSSGQSFKKEQFANENKYEV